MIEIKLSGVMVNDQDNARAFYCEKLGFEKKHDIPLGEDRWLTVVSPAAPDGVELLLEPLGFPPARTYQAALFEAGIPATAFAVDDLQAEYDRLLSLGVAFKNEPTEVGDTRIAVFDDTCGNWIQLFES